jgi:hypothetical protein
VTFLEATNNRLLILCTANSRGFSNYCHATSTLLGGSQAEASQPRSGGGEGAAAPGIGKAVEHLNLYQHDFLIITTQ